MAELLTVDDLPDGFRYPPEFIRVVELGLIDLEQWQVLEGEQLRSRYRGMAERFPERALVPFARRQDNDDVACWDGRGGPEVLIVHDYAEPGHELRETLPTFYSWLRRAVEDLIDFEPED